MRTLKRIVAALRRNLLHLATAVSLLVIALITALWFRSYTRVDYVEIRRQAIISSGGGAISVLVVRNRPDDRYGPDPPYLRYRNYKIRQLADLPLQLSLFGPPEYSSSFLRFSHSGGPYTGGEPANVALGIRYTYTEMPHWFFLLLVALMPLYWTITYPRRRRYKRLRQHLCPTCSYDLRSHAPGQACPECGTPVAPATGGKSV